MGGAVGCGVDMDCVMREAIKAGLWRGFVHALFSLVRGVAGWSGCCCQLIRAEGARWALWGGSRSRRCECEGSHLIMFQLLPSMIESVWMLNIMSMA